MFSKSHRTMVPLTVSGPIRFRLRVTVKRAENGMAAFGGQSAAKYRHETGSRPFPPGPPVGLGFIRH